MYGNSNGRTVPNQVRTPDREAHAKPHHGLASFAKPQCTLCSAEHYASSCQAFKDAAVDRRREMIKNANVCRNCLRSGHVAKDCRSGTCRKCNGKHHTLLHEDTRPTANAQANIYTLSAHRATNGLLSTAIVTIYDKDGHAHPCRALLDSGSQSHFLSKSVARKLRLGFTRVQISVQGIHSAAKTITHAVKVHLESRRTKFAIDLSCLMLETLSHTLPTQYIDRKPLNIPKTIKLADPNFHKPGPIDLILGVEIYHKQLLVGKVPLANNSAALIRTDLGWIVTGSVGGGPSHVSRCNLTTHALDRSINNFWEIEEPPTPRILSHDETAAERHYKENMQRDHNTGRYIVRLPFKDNRSLGNSYTMALKRFYALERTLARNTDRKRLYVDLMNEYAALGHMSEQGTVDHNEGYYLPHHAVFKDNSNSTKLRVVLDGSARTTSGKSLNDTLMVGPTIQDDLFTLIIRFRTHAYVLTADVTKMYRQLLVHPEDRKFQKILSREHPSQPIKVFDLNTVTYGTSAAPFLAIRSLHQLAEDEAAVYPKAATIVKRDFYVDDLLTGAKTYHEAKAIREELINLTNRGRLELRKWASNDPRLIDMASSDDAIVKLEAIDSTHVNPRNQLATNPRHD